MPLLGGYPVKRESELVELSATRKETAFVAKSETDKVAAINGENKSMLTHPYFTSFWSLGHGDKLHAHLPK